MMVISIIDIFKMLQMLHVRDKCSLEPSAGGMIKTVCMRLQLGPDCANNRVKRSSVRQFSGYLTSLLP